MKYSHYIKNNISNFKKFLFFILGLAGFFVQNEPSPFEYISIIVIFLNLNFFKKSDLFTIIFLFLLLNISSIFSYDVEKSIFYNTVTIYLVSLGFLIFRTNISVLKMFIYGGIVGIISTCFISFFNFEFFDVWYYDRLRGGFKDPNVLAPTTLFFLILMFEAKIFSERKTLKLIILTMGLSLIFLAKSRAAIGLTLFYFAIKLFYINRKFSFLYIISTIFLLLIYNIDPLINTYNDYFSSRVDTKRFLTQVKAFEIMTIFGNGATSSDFLLKHSPHNSYVRLISDNGIVPYIILLIMLCYSTLFNSKFSFNKFYLLLIPIIFSFVIDTLHWRIIFIYIGAILLIKKNKING